ncbi:MAG TPA: hypothetical protein VH025_10470 [Solirubrobacteraceae bacterium]|jgi:hypothetical protein|nr:hypothetical protein [Solirubrobacteraceae bacterium]
MPLLEVLALALAIPGAIAALGELWARSGSARHDAQSGPTRFDIDVHVRIRRS